MIVAIDGHAGSGKSTLGKRLAREFGMHYIDTGAMYRAVALHFLREGIDPNGNLDEELFREMRLEVRVDRDEFTMYLGDEDVTEAIRAREVSRMASRVAALEPVRRYLTEAQRTFSRLGDLAVDGRDIGTVVFPRAEIKIFLTAEPEERARRRYADAAGGQAATMRETLRELNARDSADSARELAPLVPAEDAHVVDTSAMDEEAVYETARRIVLENGRSA